MLAKVLVVSVDKFGDGGGKHGKIELWLIYENSKRQAVRLGCKSVIKRGDGSLRPYTLGRRRNQKR